METQSPKNISPKLFENKFLEYFTHIHPAIPIVVFGPFVAYLIATHLFTFNFLEWIGFLTLGLILWTLIEYSLHRFGFHFNATSKRGKQLIFLFHGIHHDYPHDATRLVMPLVVSIPLAFLFHWIFMNVFGPAGIVVYVGFICGYLAYDYLHFIAHHAPFKGKILTYLRIYHLKHHFKNPDLGYGVSTPLWDWILGTHPSSKKAPSLSDEPLS